MAFDYCSKNPQSQRVVLRENMFDELLLCRTFTPTFKLRKACNTVCLLLTQYLQLKGKYARMSVIFLKLFL